jgi:hypothetical protein
MRPWRSWQIEMLAIVLVVAAGAAAMLCTRSGSGTAEPLPSTEGWAGEGRSAVSGDVDGDGQLDVLVGNGFEQTSGPYLLPRRR